MYDVRFSEYMYALFIKMIIFQGFRLQLTLGNRNLFTKEVSGAYINYSSSEIENL